jgi:hypothetical protein
VLNDEAVTASYTELLENIVEVMFHSAFRDAKAFCNAFITQSGLSQCCYLLLAACQCANSANRPTMRLLHSTPLQDRAEKVPRSFSVRPRASRVLSPLSDMMLGGGFLSALI